MDHTPHSTAERVRHIMATTIEAAGVPGITVAWAASRQPATLISLGTDAAGHPVTPTSLFPVASLTKLAVALAILRLADSGALAVADPVAHYLPDAVVAPSGATLRNLLTHTAGLPESYPDEPDLYRLGLTWPRIAQASLRTAPTHAPSTRVRYSGVGYSLLAVIIERVTALPFAAALQELVLDPLAIEAYLGVEPPRPPMRIDVGDSLFAGTALEFYNSSFFRSLGEPTSGLVTTAAGALHLVRAFHDSPPGFLRPTTRAAATADQTGGLGGGVGGWFDLAQCPWGFGPGRYGTFPPLIPVHASPASFGHHGASGCLVWCDPRAERAWVILGTQTSDSGWSTSCFPAIGATILASAPDQER